MAILTVSSVAPARGSFDGVKAENIGALACTCNALSIAVHRQLAWALQLNLNTRGQAKSAERNSSPSHPLLVATVNVQQLNSARFSVLTQRRYRNRDRRRAMELLFKLNAKPHPNG